METRDGDDRDDDGGDGDGDGRDDESRDEDGRDDDGRDGFEERTAPYRRELLTHCYRMLGSVHEAEDLVQETMLRAWIAYDRYDAARASLRTWLYRIATNTCLTALRGRARRPLPSGLVGALEDPGAPMTLGAEVPWLEPFPDRGTAGLALGAGATAGDPAGVVVARGSLRLALIAAMQLLPPRQRAVLILRDVLAWPATEVAEALGTSTASVNSALQRARARLGEASLTEDEVTEPPDHEQRAVIDRYLRAFEDADLDALRILLTEDVVLEMPPVLNWYVGPDAYVAFIARVFAMRGTDWRLRSTSANGQPALAAYVRAPGDDKHRLHTLQVFTADHGAVSHTVVFQLPTVFAAFGLPEVWER
ncbi:sigma-70 family RNA polymerase sigma factor [Streptomyces rhizosphaerihabitans]|uniref:sigma-70 family RNA polymerase sigma factor n=1 Tax=Streptomyces rhizosphaerihabitans TaxID=1266770 RepID=UPI0021C1E176|nr:sigma-70 family RNA polymerase sigma factor [Streptomyces rhizosphaerihabitans]MCT9010622.1 sigma-70 family RNA polymerase sigma factor [Streptomyces rhizosphaerihabitans]